MKIIKANNSDSIKKSEILSEQNIALEKRFEYLQQKTERLKNEYDQWQSDFREILELREKGSNFEKANQPFEAIEVYLKAIDFGEKSEFLNINNYAFDIERIVILYGKIRDKGNQIDFLQRVIETYPEYRDVKGWAVRLTKLVGNNQPKKNLKPSDIANVHAGIPTIGKQFEDFKSTLPEFNFYYDMPEGMQTFEYLGIKQIIPTYKFKDLRNFRESFQIILSKAKMAENQGNYKTAIEAYEKLIVEEYEGKQPYERLMIIYRKLKWEEQEIDILERAIAFFEGLRKKQKDNILLLAKKYGMESKALEYIQSEKKIQYYGGVFDLYSPNPTIKKWKARLEAYQC